MRNIITPQEAQRRLLLLFPREAFDTVMSSPLCAHAIASLIYVDAIENGADTFWSRPSMVTWLNVQTLSKDQPQDRLAWRRAAHKGFKHVENLLTQWEIPTTTSYADNTRETLRDETYRKLNQHGAMCENPAVHPTSPAGRWALYSHFADLFDPELDETEFESRADQWRDNHLSPAARTRLSFLIEQETQTHAIIVQLPNTYATRSLSPGGTSLILKEVIEQWALTRLDNPYLIMLSEPGDKIYLGDRTLLQQLKVEVDVSKLLPDLIMADVRDNVVHYWFIEVAFTDGVIDDQRKLALFEWAEAQGISRDDCYFMTAFASRRASVARSRLKDLAEGTYAFFADEPGHELAWYALEDVARTKDL